MNCPFYSKVEGSCTRDNDCEHRIEWCDKNYCRSGGHTEVIPSIGKWFEYEKPKVIIGATIELPMIKISAQR